MDKEFPPAIINHFSHGHSLKLIEVKRGFYTACYCCGLEYGSDRNTAAEAPLMYACSEEQCRYSNTLSPAANTQKGEYLCLVCAALGVSTETHHALHPQHSLLGLVNNWPLSFATQHWLAGKERVCGACCKDIRNDSFSYRCHHDGCHFELHVICAHSLNPTLHHPSHSHHLLTLMVSGYGTNRTLKCGSCKGKIGLRSDFARCVPCNLNYHINCERPSYRMPEMLACPQRHPQHPLSLLVPCTYTGYSSCDVCAKRRDWKSIPKYACLECNSFMAHLSCLVQHLPCPFSRSVRRSNFSGLRIKDSPVHEAALCQACKECILDRLSVYGCQYCNFFVHLSCIRKWLREPMGGEMIYVHPGYGNDPLVLVFAHGKQFTCACCNRNCSGFMFQRENQESFVLDLECMLLKPSLELIGHDHTVILLQEGNATKSSYLRCIPCRQSFSIAESSCRFPYTLVHECHFHPLILVPYLVDDDDVDQCCCDVCEGERDPNECVYHCAQCKFEAHIGCVKQEVVGPSRNKSKEVKFVTLQDIKKDKDQREEKIKIRDVFCLEKELQHSYTLLVVEFDNIFQKASRMKWENSVGETHYDVEHINKVLYSDEPFKKFIKEINSGSFLKRIRSTLESLKNEEVVYVRGYLVPLNSEEMVETLFDKYGDFGAECTCSREAKQYIFVGLCKALESMCNTKAVRVKKNLLMKWWTWFIIGKAAGFKIHFALKILKRVAHAYFGLKADKYADGKLTSIRRKIRELPQKIEKLSKKLEKLRRELEGAKHKEKELREAAFRVKKSHLMRECLNEAEDLVCYSLGELLFDD